MEAAGRENLIPGWYFVFDVFTDVSDAVRRGSTSFDVCREGRARKLFWRHGNYRRISRYD
jgi:hypothetical protein